jgi:hypothetical protein
MEEIREIQTVKEEKTQVRGPEKGCAIRPLTLSKPKFFLIFYTKYYKEYHKLDA